MAEKQSNWGGSRKGAGRRPRYGEPMIPKSVRLPQGWIDQLVEEFDSFQRAIETLVKNHIDKSVP
jgi:hypothetical protein